MLLSPIQRGLRAIAVLLLAAALGAPALARADVATASTTAPGSSPAGARDGDRFAVESSRLWRGAAGESGWWWQVDLGVPRAVGALLQIHGDHAFVLRNSPADYYWEASLDGTQWTPLAGALQSAEDRMYRLHRLDAPVNARWLRLKVRAAHGEAPVLREVEVFDSAQARVDFPPWCVLVNATHDRTLPGHGQEFLPLAKSVPGWERLEAQQVLLSTLREAFLRPEPHPVCAFISGSFKDWCEVDRTSWRGLEGVLKAGCLPIWASCGGAQGLAIVSEHGTAQPWDCPHCRDPRNPRTPIYGHIAHTARRPCGDYSGCVFERGLHAIRQAAPDPAFRSLPEVVQLMESHCGQIEYVPRGWSLVATGGEGTRTRIQCLRRSDRYIYAAQFHLEMAGAEETARKIIGNFLRLAADWGGYNPEGVAVPAP
jgi:hypothetical protein